MDRPTIHGFRSISKSSSRSIRAALGFALVVCAASRASAQNATVTLASQKQYIRGFGGMTHAAWAGDLTAAERTLAFGNAAGQLGFSVLRIPVTDGTPNSVNVATAKAALANGAIVFATPWNAARTYTSADFPSYATHLNNFVSYMKSQGVDLYAISVQNEPDYGATAGWGSWTAAACHDFILNYGATITTKLMSCESYNYQKSYYDPILNDTAALANTGVFGTHLYGTPVAAYAYPLFDQKGAGKERWMTEHYTDSTTDANAWPNALGVASELHNAMVIGQFSAYVWWYIKRSYGPINNGAVTKRGYCMAHWSKFVRPGFHRVDATASPTSGLSLSAFEGDSTVVIVVVNTNSSSRSLNVSIPDSTVASFSKYTTSSSKSLAGDGTVSASNGSMSVSLDASSVTTLVGSGTTSTGGSGGTGGTGTGGVGTGGIGTGGIGTGGIGTGGVGTGGVGTGGVGTGGVGTGGVGTGGVGGTAGTGGSSTSGSAGVAGGSNGGIGGIGGSMGASGGAAGTSASGGVPSSVGGFSNAGANSGGGTNSGAGGRAAGGDAQSGNPSGCSCRVEGGGTRPEALALFGLLGMLTMSTARRRGTRSKFARATAPRRA